MKLPVAVQLYSVRDEMEKDFYGTIRTMKEIGYDGVEFAGYFNTDAATIKAKLDELGLVAVGGHIGLGDFEGDKLAETIEFQNTLGVKAIGVGGAPHSTMLECANTGVVLGKAQEYAMEKYGMKVYYHNHCEEFEAMDKGILPIDVIGGCCSLEIDTYWSFHAGMDNYKFITENKDNIILLHVKDGIDGKPKALGEGNCDIPAVVKAAKDIGMEWLIVENDDPVPTGFEDITRSLKYLKSII